MLCDLVDPSSRLWSACLKEVRHDVYHLPEYVQLCSDLYPGGIPRAFIARDEAGLLFVPLILRPIDNDWISSGGFYDAISPYGYGSPILALPSRSLGDWNSQNRFLERAIECLVQCLLKEHVVSVFCRLHPMLPLPQQSLRYFGTVVDHGPTVYCNLAGSREELWHQTRGALRRKINQVQAAGFVAEEDSDWSSVADFEELYRDTMHRVGAADWYFFSHDHFIGLRDNLANVHLLVVRFKGQVACAGLLSETCGIVQYHLAGTRCGFEQSGAIKLLTHFAREWGKARGNNVFHLGGGVGGAEDSLFYFKSGFSKDRGVFQTWRLVVDHQVYDELVTERRMNAEVTTEDGPNYFPEYRTEVLGRCSSLQRSE